MRAHFPQMTSSIVVTPKRHFLARKHVVWAIRRENRSTGSTWAQDREKRTGQSKKSQRRYISPIWGEAPTEPIFTKNLRSSCRPRRNHVCKLLSWNFQGLRFYMGSNFPFSCWFFHGPYCAACDPLMNNTCCKALTYKSSNTNYHHLFVTKVTHIHNRYWHQLSIYNKQFQLFHFDNFFLIFTFLQVLQGQGLTQTKGTAKTEVHGFETFSLQLLLQNVLNAVGYSRHKITIYILLKLLC